MFHKLVGTTILEFNCNEYRVRIVTNKGACTLEHYQDCCEHVTLEDVIGDPTELVGAVVRLAEVRTSDDDPPGARFDDLTMWTFYELRTDRGDITLRWFGSSNGYYSVGVDTRWDPRA